jgi:uncharacterized membrane protein
MSVDEALKYVISMGVVPPRKIRKRPDQSKADVHAPRPTP